MNSGGKTDRITHASHRCRAAVHRWFRSYHLTFRGGKKGDYNHLIAIFAAFPRHSTILLAVYSVLFPLRSIEICRSPRRFFSYRPGRRAKMAMASRIFSRNFSAGRQLRNIMDEQFTPDKLKSFEKAGKTNNVLFFFY